MAIRAEYVRQSEDDCPADGPTLTLIDVFAGAGGISEGFRQAGFRVLGGVDHDPDAAATYHLNFPEARTVVGDIRRSEVYELVLDLGRAADVVVGGPPCQAFSQVRNHSRVIDDPRNSLYTEFVSILRAIRPKAFLMENVTGMDQMGVRAQITEDLALGGEYLVRPQVLDAADFGVPQTRKRLFFLGLHASLGMPPAPEGTGATESITLVRFPGSRNRRYELVARRDLFTTGLADALRDPADTSVVSASDAISDLESLPTGRRNDEIRYVELPAPNSGYQRLMRRGAGPMLSNVQVPRMNADTAMRLRGIPQGGNYRDLREALLHRYLTDQHWGQDNGTGQLSRRHFYAYRRLHPGIWAWTLSTKADAVYHYAAPRSLSVREFARLQSFPDRFVFTTDPRKGAIPGRIEGGPGHSRYRQAGNAVPVLLARAIGEAIRDVVAAAAMQKRRTA
jgi:DNA (cytosine-5)-methyltransferase 1